MWLTKEWIFLENLYIKLYHYKFPKNELRGLSHEEWMDMLKLAEKMPEVPTTEQDLIRRNPLIALNSPVKDADSVDKYDFSAYFKMRDLGEVEDAKSVQEFVQRVKKIIDGHSNDPRGEESPKTPLEPSKLVPA